MSRCLVVVVALLAFACPGPAAAAPPDFRPGAPGIGDPYFPLAGNGGYDVLHYRLRVRYAPATDVLHGTAVIRAAARQDLSRFDLDLEGLTVRSVRVAGASATWTRDGQELVITPAHGIRKRTRFTVAVRYRGVPKSTTSPTLGEEGFFHTADGALVVGQPDSSRFWYPSDEHPRDGADFRARITVPAGLQAISNGRLVRHSRARGKSVWNWSAPAMTSYETFMAVGHFDVTRYKRDGIRFLDAVDRKLATPYAPHSGDRFAYSQTGDSTYKRLTRTVTVPGNGGKLSFWVNRSTQNSRDFFFVEAHTSGRDDWTTLPDEHGHTSQDTGDSCRAGWQQIHPFLARYQTPADDGCSPTGTSGAWNAATGMSSGYERWTVDLSVYAGQQVEVSLAYASDNLEQFDGVFVDDITTPTGDGDTSFEDDGDPLDGWTVSGAPEGSPGNANDWTVVTAADVPKPVGAKVGQSFAREPEILRFLAGVFGPYPFHDAGGVVDDVDLGFALETETRPVYGPGFWSGSVDDATSTVVHEDAHQWTGDLVRLARWRDIWLNEGFATYAEWLWSGHEGGRTPQESFNLFASAIPPDDPFWSVAIGDPGPDSLFDGSVYLRGAMTLQALRTRIGDHAFFRLLRLWPKRYGGQAVTTDDFVALAERVSHQQLDDLFDKWLYTPGRPASLPAASRAGSAAASVERSPAPFGRSALKR